ncbi:MAG: hypothetical protein IBJ03_17775 [Gemmatimonadaceae bacterium]|nr:hypothetical protein [Gemmatimonadaceae bacterium]
MPERSNPDATTIWLIPMVVLLVVGLRTDLFVWGDTWYNLTLGREIITHGIMRVDTLSAVWMGLPVVDVQWLAHAVFYGLARVLGVAAVPAFGLLLIAFTLITVALAHCTRTDEPIRPGVVLLTVALVLMAIGSQLVLRAQTLVYPLLVWTVWVVQRNLLRPSRALWSLVPVSLLWANLHGSVLLAPLIVGAAFVVVVAEGLWGSREEWKSDASRFGVLTAATALSVVCTPYGLGVLHYYRETAGSPLIRSMISEWFPLWAAPEIGIVALVVLIAVVVLRARGQWYARVVLGGMLLMTVTSVRHATPLALTALVLLPPLLEQTVPARWTFTFREVPVLPVRLVSALALLWLIAGVPWRLGPTMRAPDVDSPEAAIERIARDRPDACLFVDEQQAERLIWFFPDLKGKVAHGVRVETLPLSYFLQVAGIYGQPDAIETHRLLGRFDATLLDARLRERLIAALATDSAFKQVAHQRPVVAFQPKVRSSGASPCQDAHRSAVRELASRS